MLGLGTAANQSAGNINNCTNGNTGQTYNNLIDDQGNDTGFTFSIVLRADATEERDYGLNNSYFSAADEQNSFSDAFQAFGNGGTWRFSNLNAQKTYTIRLSGASETTSLTDESGLRITIAGDQDTIDNQYFNTTKYMGWTGIAPNRSSQIDITFQDDRYRQ